MNIIPPLLPAIEHFHMAGYWIALFAALFETTIGIGLIIPGSTIVLIMGAFAAQGYFDVGDLIWFAAVGAILGDNVNFFVGKKYGAKLITGGFWFIKPKHFQKGKEFFEQHGAKSIFIGRFVPSIKEMIPLIAGMFGMKRLPFMFWNILGAIGWSLVWILPGYFFSQSLDIAKIWITRTGLFFTVLAIVLILFYLLKTMMVKRGKKIFAFLHSVWLSVKLAIKENPEVRKFTDKHKIFFAFLYKRFDRNDFLGLPLTLLALSLLYALMLSGGIIEDIVNSDVIVSFDVRIANFLAVFRYAGLTKIFIWITLLGKWQVVLAFTAAAIPSLWLWNKKNDIMPLLASIGGSTALVAVGKIIFHRARPGAAVYPEDSFSFPSAHAAIAVAFYGYIAYLAIKNTKRWNRKINYFFACLGIIILIGFSRLYLGVHYLSDVWGGYLTGLICLIAAISLSEFISYKKTIAAAAGNIRIKRYITIFLVFSAFIFYVLFAINYKLPVIAL